MQGQQLPPGISGGAGTAGAGALGTGERAFGGGNGSAFLTSFARMAPTTASNNPQSPMAEANLLRCVISLCSDKRTQKRPKAVYPSGRNLAQDSRHKDGIFDTTRKGSRTKNRAFLSVRLGFGLALPQNDRFPFAHPPIATYSFYCLDQPIHVHWLAPTAQLFDLSGSNR